MANTIEGYTANRKFHGSFPSYEQKNEDDSSSILNFIDSNVIGKSLSFNGPFGQRNALCCDYTASGRSLKFIEDYIQTNVLPHYGNTHTTTSVTSLQTTMFRDEARDIIRNAVNASENDALIFTGSGCTAAVNKLIHALDLKVPPIVFVSPYEHHSNLLPWKEVGAEIIWIEEVANGGIDLTDLEYHLKAHQTCGRPLFGCFSAASNVTGILVDVDAVASCLHRYNALAFFDFATAGPYLEINMNPSSNTESFQSYKDAVFLAPHKFVGGPGTPGILVAKKKLFRNQVPSNGGGGSVFFVTESTHRYLQNIEMKEEGGTPAIVESIRAGLVFQLKQKVTTKLIENRDKELISMANKAFENQRNLILLGIDTNNKLPIFSFVIKHKSSGRLLHHNFVSVVLNDLFGVQSRAGCACTGPYAQKLLGMTEKVALEIENLLLEDQRLDRHHLRRQREYSDKEMLRPGFTRINLPYFYNNETIGYILEAVMFVAEHGWKLLPQYIFNPETGEWKQKQYQPFKDRKWLGSIWFQNDTMNFPVTSTEDIGLSFKDLLSKAHEIVLKASKANENCPDQTVLFGDLDESYRWFILPCEAKMYLKNKTPPSCVNNVMPFTPGECVKEPKSKQNRFLSSTTNLHLCNCSKLFSLESLSERLAKSNEQNGISFDRTFEKISNDSSDTNKLAVQTQNGETLTANSKTDNMDIESCKIFNGNSDDTPKYACLLPRKNKDKVIADNNNTVIKAKFHSPPKRIFTTLLEAINEFGMIKDNDRVLLCLSGGKDSLSMLHAIHQYKFYARGKGINFNFGAMTVDPQSSGYDPSPLKDYLKSLNVPYFYEEQDIIGAAANLTVCESICSFCSRMKRGRIYACARREGYNVVALGQHLDDIAESFLMSTFHNGYLRSMKANYTVKEEDLRVIRPLVYTREKDLRDFADKMKLPVIPENCPACFEAPKERHRMKQLLAQQEVIFPNLFQSLRSALHPLVSKDKTGLEKRKLDDVDDDT